MTLSPLKQRRTSDYVGFCFFLALVASGFAAGREMALLMSPLLLQNLLIALSFLIRKPAAAQITSLGARLVSYGNAFVILIFTTVAGRWFPEWFAATRSPSVSGAGVLLYFLGLVLSIGPLYALRHAFSLEPQARRLVVSGWYRWARHPIYAAYLVEFTGLLLWHLTPAFLVVYGAYLVLMVYRIRYEEAVLEATFPEYATYRRAVGAFGPRWGGGSLRSRAVGARRTDG